MHNSFSPTLYIFIFLIVSVFTRRLLNTSQPNFATCLEMSHICKCIRWKLGGSIPCNVGSRTTYFRVVLWRSANTERNKQTTGNIFVNHEGSLYTVWKFDELWPKRLWSMATFHPPSGCTALCDLSANVYLFVNFIYKIDDKRTRGDHFCCWKYTKIHKHTQYGEVQKRINK